MTISKRISLCFLIQTVVYRSNVTPSVLERSSPSDQIKNQNDKRNHEQQMNKSAANMSEKADKPENKKNYNNHPKHKFIPIIDSNFATKSRV